MRKLENKPQRVQKMATTLRLKDAEQERIRKKCIEINKLLVREGHEPLKDSELVHELLDKAIDMAQVTKSGKIELVC